MNFSGAIHLNKTGIGVLCGLILILIFYSFSNRYNSSSEKIENNLINLHRLLEAAIKAAENGGKQVIEVKDTIKIKSKGFTKEGLQDSVTTADYLSHCSMTFTLRQYFPMVKIVSEEEKTSCKNDQIIDYSLHHLNFPSEVVDVEDVTIWIDPLDATYEYSEKSEKLYHFVTTMVCVAVKGKPIIGVIHKPFKNITSWAWVDKGRSPDLTNIPVHQKEDKLKIIISRSHRGKIETVLNENFPNKFDLVIAAGAGYKALEVAYGNVSAYVHNTEIKKWDICAGNAILNAVGGKMTTINNQEIDYKDDLNVKNGDGLIASVKNHDIFIGKL